MQEQNTAAQAASASSIRLVQRCNTTRARAETRKRIKAKQKQSQKAKKKVKSRVPYTRQHMHNALDALIDGHYNKRRDKTVMSIRKAARIYMDNKFSTLNRFVKKYSVIEKIKSMKK